ncbi:MAG: hypothetical protein V4574_15545 [Pseudomonadota bacterium]
MDRPAAITWFERFYLGAIALKIVVVVLNWTTANPGAAQIGLIVSLLLWFGVVYRHSAISRWLAVLFVAVTMGWGCYLIAMGAYDTLSAALALVAMVLSALAAGQLLSPGAGAWFAKDRPA